MQTKNHRLPCEPVVFVLQPQLDAATYICGGRAGGTCCCCGCEAAGAAGDTGAGATGATGAATSPCGFTSLGCAACEPFVSEAAGAAGCASVAVLLAAPFALAIWLSWSTPLVIRLIST